MHTPVTRKTPHVLQRSCLLTCLSAAMVNDAALPSHIVWSLCCLAIGCPFADILGGRHTNKQKLYYMRTSEFVQIHIGDSLMRTSADWVQMVTIWWCITCSLCVYIWFPLQFSQNRSMHINVFAMFESFFQNSCVSITSFFLVQNFELHTKQFTGNLACVSFIWILKMPSTFQKHTGGLANLDCT